MTSASPCGMSHETGLARSFSDDQNSSFNKSASPASRGIPHLIQSKELTASVLPPFPQLQTRRVPSPHSSRPFVVPYSPSPSNFAAFFPRTQVSHLKPVTTAYRESEIFGTLLISSTATPYRAVPAIISWLPDSCHSALCILHSALQKAPPFRIFRQISFRLISFPHINNPPTHSQRTQWQTDCSPWSVALSK